MRFPFCKIGIFMHGAAGISHGMCVFAHDQRFFRIFFQESFHLRHRRIHAAFDISCVVITPVPGDALIMDRAVRIELMEELAHLINNVPSIGLVAAGPDNHAGMVFIPFIDRTDTVQQKRRKFLMIFRNNIIRSCFSAEVGIPAAMGFHIVFIQYIQTVPVAERIKF